jgi:hypothetical protein
LGDFLATVVAASDAADTRSALVIAADEVAHDPTSANRRAWHRDRGVAAIRTSDPISI